MKKRYFFFLFLSFFFLFSKVEAIDTSLKVYDDADLLTDAEEISLQEKVKDFINTYEMDMILVSTRDNDFSTPREYAIWFFTTYHFGIGDKEDGILFLIDRSSGYNDVYILTHGEAIRVYDDARIDGMLDDVEVYKGNYGKMYEAFVESASSYAALGVAPSNRDTYVNEEGNLSPIRKMPWLGYLFFSLVLTIVIMIFLLSKHKMVKKETRAKEYIVQNSIHITRQTQNFRHTHTTSHYIGSSSSSGGHVGGSSHSGGFGGGGRRM